MRASLPFHPSNARAEHQSLSEPVRDLPSLELRRFGLAAFSSASWVNLKAGGFPCPRPAPESRSLGRNPKPVRWMTEGECMERKLPGRGGQLATRVHMEHNGKRNTAPIS